MTADRSLRVYFVTHWDGRLTGTLLRRSTSFFDAPPPSAYGATEDDVLAQIDVHLQAAVASREDALERYLWEDTFTEQTITLDVYPQTVLNKRPVVGARRVPLEMTYLSSKMEGGGFRIMVPRVGGWFIVEDLAVARDVVRQAIGFALLGEEPRSLYDFRVEGGERVRAWSPRIAASRDALGSKAADFPVVRAVADDLVEHAARGKLPASVGEPLEIDALFSLMTSAARTSVLLVGGAGVGKSSWVKALARRMLERRRVAERTRAPRPPRLWATTDGRILSGMTYLGMWQQRCLKLVDELSHSGDYLCVDRLGGLLAPQPDGSSIADVLLPALRADEISLLAECTEEELEVYQRRAATLMSCFRIVRVPELSLSAMLAFVEAYEARKSSPARLHPAARKRLLRHLETFRRDVRFPGKAVRFLDWLHQEAKREGRTRVLYPRDVSAAYARFSGLPLELIADEIPSGAAEIGAKLSAVVVGQDEACATAARVLARFKAGLNDPERPIGALLFVGPTGVGKTELAKELARTMFGDAKRMIRVDMSELMLPGASARLLDASPGGSSLAQRVRQEPLSLVLLDEVEKAAPDVFDVLLGVLGEGRLSDSEGRFVDFRMTLLVMTSNLGVASARPVGFGEPAKTSSLASVRAHFRPELVNRIDHVVTFSALRPEDMLAIVDLELKKANARTGLVRRNLTVALDGPARARLAELGYDPARGARPLLRVLEERVMTPLALKLAADPSLRDRRVLLALSDVEAAGAPVER